MKHKGFVDEMKMILPKPESLKEEKELERLFLQLAFLRCSRRAFIKFKLK